MSEGQDVERIVREFMALDEEVQVNALKCRILDERYAKAEVVRRVLSYVKNRYVRVEWRSEKIKERLPIVICHYSYKLSTN